MRRFVIGLTMLLGLGAPGSLFAAHDCEKEAGWTETPSQRHYMVLAGREDVFHDRSGPAFVMLIKTGPQEYEIGAIGIHAGENGQPVFGAVPAATYEEFLREPDEATDVMLRLRINGPQYDRALQVLQSWDRRAREGALLYPDIAMDNILLVKLATEELNRCTEAIVSYPLDWSLDDRISEDNIASRVPLEYFRELRRLNPAKHVPDADMPGELLAAIDASHDHHVHTPTQE